MAVGLPGWGLGHTGFHCLHPQGERATGWCGLLLALFGQASEDPLLNRCPHLAAECMGAQEGDSGEGLPEGAGLCDMAALLSDTGCFLTLH